MNRRRPLATLVALALVAVGVLFAFRPTLARTAVPPINILYVSAVGIAALALAFGLVIRQSIAEPRRIEPSALPTPPAIPTPGSAIDVALADPTNPFRETVVEYATETLANALDIDDEAARMRLGESDWLPDELAAVLDTTESSPATEPERRLRTHITVLLDALADVTGRSLAHIRTAGRSLARIPPRRPPCGGAPCVRSRRPRRSSPPR